MFPADDRFFFATAGTEIASGSCRVGTIQHKKGKTINNA